METSKMEIDDSLYSRQRYMLGDQAMKKMALSSVLLMGCDSLGVEIAKNLVLTGIGSLTIADSPIVTEDDVEGNFYVNKCDFENKVTRAEACVPRVAELNPYVNVLVSTIDVHLMKAVEGNTDSQNILRDCIGKMDCIIASNCDFNCVNYLNKLCRDSPNRGKFICASVYGLFSSIFCDFGANFEVLDAKGENLQEAFVANISKGNPGVVTCSDNKPHGLEDGDFVVFREIQGMEELNGNSREVRVISPYAFSIGDNSNLSQYTGGGIVKQMNVKMSVSHERFQVQLFKPDILIPDLGKLENSMISHVGFIALNNFIDAEHRCPTAWNENDAEKVFAKYLELVKDAKFDAPTNDFAKNIVYLLSFTCAGVLPPLAAAVGGIAAQEVLKSLTGKYTPLKQWLYLDAVELVGNLANKPTEEDAIGASSIAKCLGKDVSNHLSRLKIFMVGCGAIGCEMLKNLALLGVSCGGTEGKISITDNDVIEKSNLNRQFLFRNRHVGQFKSSVAASVAREITPTMTIRSMQYKVGPDSEQNVFHDAFFESQDIIINALDNLQARRYVDARCVTNQRPLIESGTMGPKGHVQVIVPFVTESYGSQQDPGDVQYPFCTLKSFPSQIEHTVQWARGKFEVVFNQKPTTFNKFQEGYNRFLKTFASPNVRNSFSEYLTSGGSVQDAAIAVKLISESPRSWSDCVSTARHKFEKYFNHKAKDLLQAFPLDTQLEDGSPFWSLPKRPPTPIVFDSSNTLHMQFITSFASLFASIHTIETPTSMKENSILVALKSAKVPDFVPSNKEIITDENAPVPEPSTSDSFSVESLSEKEAVLNKSGGISSLRMSTEEFEKDDDSNYHVDFISSAANLRAAMYGIETVDRLEAKRIAGRIIPAISTTTSAVAGFATIQFLQLAIQSMKNIKVGKTWTAPDAADLDEQLCKYRNCFLNLALPLVIFSEPAAAQQTAITDTVSCTPWDRWVVQGNKDYKLKDFVQHFKSSFNFTVSAVLHGSKMVYIPIMPGHTKRLNHHMTKLIKVGNSVPYVDLTITFESDTTDDTDLPCPPVRYYF